MIAGTAYDCQFELFKSSDQLLLCIAYKAYNYTNEVLNCLRVLDQFIILYSIKHSSSSINYTSLGVGTKEHTFKQTTEFQTVVN